MSHFIAYLYRIGYPVLRLYWFVRRPITTGVKCLIVNDGQLLLVRHTYGSTLRTTVGGGIKSGESLEQAARREVYEEVGIRLDRVTKVGVVSHQTEYKHDTVHVFLAYTESVILELQTTEILEAGWYPLDTLPADVSPRLQQFLDLVSPYLR